MFLEIIGFLTYSTFKANIDVINKFMENYVGIRNPYRNIKSMTNLWLQLQ